METEKPLILSPAAAKRMQLLLERANDTADNFQNIQNKSDRPELVTGDVDGSTWTDAFVELKGSILESYVRRGEDALLTEEKETRLCRHLLHDCVAYKHVLNRLQVQSGDLVEVFNIERPEISPRIARLWEAGDDEAIESDIQVSPYLAHNIGIAYHVAPFVSTCREHLWNDMFRISVGKYSGGPRKDLNPILMQRWHLFLILGPMLWQFQWRKSSVLPL